MRARGTLVACAIVALAACSFQHGQGSTTQPPADTGSGGSGGSDAALADAAIDAPVAPDASVSTACGSDCSDEGGTCNGNVCELPTTGGLTCPQMNQCTIDCPTDNSCHTGGFTCDNDANCRLNCVGDHTCDNGQTLECKQGSTCDIHCDGAHSCDNATVQCDLGATCIIHCCGGFASCHGACTGNCNFLFTGCP